MAAAGTVFCLSTLSSLTPAEVAALLNLPEVPIAGIMPAAHSPLRAAARLPPATRIVLFQGRLGPGLGLETAAEAVLAVPDAALVLLGFGRGVDASRGRDRDPRYAGRHVTLPSRHPDELLAWTVGADVALIPLPASSVNQRLSTPNKFWEAIAAGTPVVVVRGLEVMERLVREYDARFHSTADGALDDRQARVEARGAAIRSGRFPGTRLNHR